METSRLNVITAFLNSILNLKMLTLLGIFIFSISALAMNGRTTYQAKIIKPDGYPLEASSVNFRFTVLDTVGSCVLYVEDYTAVNMSQSGGLISFALGNGARSFPASGTSQTFQNTFDNSVTSFSCQTPGIYNPGPNDTRKIVMQFHDGNGWQTLPAMTINTVPYAMYASKSNDSKTLNGKADTAFVENSTLAALNCNPATHAITFNGVSFSCISVGSSGGGITSVTTSGTVLSTGGTASAPVISIQAATMSQDGYLTSLDYAEFKAKLTASSTQIVNTLGYAPVSSSAVTTQINNSNLSGDVSGTISSNSVVSVGGKSASQISTSVDDTLAATTSATANTIVKRNSLGNFTANDVYVNAAKINYVDIYKPSASFNIRLQAPTSLSTNYVLNLPTTSGTTGQVLSTDGAGNLSWINPSIGSVVSVSATAPLASSGGSNPTISITQATSSTDGYLSSTDWNTFNNKQAATSAAIIATLGYTPADNAASGTYAQKANNLSDLTSSATARTNLGLGTLATANSIDLGSASATGIIAEARLQTQSSVTSGTQYTKVTVDGKGRVTSGAQLSSGDVTTALGYTPATSTTLAASFVQKTGDTMTGLLNLPSNGLVVGSNQLVVSSTNVGVGVLNPTAALQLKAGTTTNAPLKFTSGTLLSSAQSGTIEYDGSQLYFTDGANARRAIATNSTPGSFDNTSSISNTSGNITLSPNNITGSVIVNSSQASISSGTGALVVNGGVGIAGSINAGGNLNLSGSATIGQSLQLSSMTSGSLLFAGASGLVSEDNSRLFWDGANKRLGLGTNSPAQTLSVSGASYFSGNVGIGTNAPTQKLEVVGGKIQIDNNQGLYGRSTSGSLSRAIIAGNSSDNVEIGDSGGWNNVIFYPGSGEKMRITSFGNVGIGTSAPSAKLDVNDVSPMIRLSQQSSGKSILSFYDLQAGATRWELYNDGADANKLKIWGFGGITPLNIDTAGNVGIGTTSPQGTLNVEKLANAATTGTDNLSLLINQRNAGNTEVAGEATGIGFNRAATNSTHVGAKILFISDGSGFGRGDLAFTTKGAASNGDVPSERMRILANGNVGIGTTSPSGVLHLSSNATTGSQLIIQNTDTGGATVGIISTGSTNTGGAGLMRFDNPMGTERMVITNTGNVGIGTTNPQAKLDVAGSIAQNGRTTEQSGVIALTADGTYQIASGSELDGIYELNWSGPNRNDYKKILVTSRQFDQANIIILASNNYSNQSVISNIRVTGDASGAIRYLLVDVANRNGSTTNLFVRAYGPTPSLVLASSGYGTTAITNVASILSDRSGNVGIGTTSPAAKLHVNGDMMVGTPSASFTTSVGIPANDPGGHNAAMVPTNITFGSGGANMTYKAVRNGANTFNDEYITFATHEGGISIGERMRITPNGNVGIGTTNPQRKLNVVGSVGVQDSSLAHIHSFSDTNGGANIDAYSGTSDSYFSVNTNLNGAGTSEKMRITGAGNVGIGTTAPAGKLDVSGSVYIGDGTGGALFLKKGSDLIIRDFDGTSEREYNMFMDNGTAYTRVDSVADSDALGKHSVDARGGIYLNPNGGNVGIGTTAPQTSLDVNGRTTLATTSAHVLSVTGKGTTYSDAIDGIATFYSEVNVAAGGNVIKAGSAYAPNTFVVKDNGNVGVGTTTPAYKLQVNGNVDIVQAQGTAGNAFYRASTLGGSGDFSFGADNGSGAGNNAFIIYDRVNSAYRLAINNAGNVGIGTTSPSYKLDVSGTIRGYGITDSSDIRLKKDIQPLDFSLEKLLQVNGVSYHWKNPAMPKKQIGFIAQQLEKIYPELVETDQDGFKSVNYSHLIAPVIESIKTLYHRTVNTERRVASLEKINNDQEKQIQAMQKVLCEMGRQEFCNDK